MSLPASINTLSLCNQKRKQWQKLASPHLAFSPGYRLSYLVSICSCPVLAIFFLIVPLDTSTIVLSPRRKATSPDSGHTSGGADLALEDSVIFERHPLHLQREDALLVIANHLVARIGGQVPDDAEPELVPRPLHLTHRVGHLGSERAVSRWSGGSLGMKRQVAKMVEGRCEVKGWRKRRRGDHR